jgi:two-component system, chemotaxis family, chemotaxis protein CheY
MRVPGAADEEHAPTVSIQLRQVLIADEAVPVRRKLLECLHRAGFPIQAVSMASDREEALEAFVLKHPRLVFCELLGNDEDGLAFILELLSIDPQAKVVLVTAHDPQAEPVKRALRAGVYGIVQKPLRHHTVRQLLAEIEADEGGIERFR